MIEIKLTLEEVAALLLLAVLALEAYPTRAARLLDRIPQEVFDSLGKKLNGALPP